MRLDRECNPIYSKGRGKFYYTITHPGFRYFRIFRVTNGRIFRKGRVSACHP